MRCSGSNNRCISSTQLCFISDIPGVLVNDKVLHFADQKKIEQLIQNQTINGGMIFLRST